MSFHILIIFWGHAMKKPKKPWENQKNKKKTKKTIFSDSSGVTPWKNQKNLEKTKKTKKTKKKQYLAILWGGGPRDSF